MPFRKRLLKATAGSRQDDGMGTAWERHDICELASAVQKRHVGNLPAFGVSLLPRGVPESLLSEPYKYQMQVASVNAEKLIILVQGHECLCNLRHKHDNNLVKDNCCKEIAGEWRGSSRFAAWERHGMSESAFTGGRDTELTQS
jgi:hypothetical protein